MYNFSKNNPFRNLRHEGVLGKVSDDFDSITIYSKGDESVVITAGLLAPPSCWDFGFKITPGDFQKLPGEGSGWFNSKKDVLLFGLAELRSMFVANSPQRFAIDEKLNELMSPTLF